MVGQLTESEKLEKVLHIVEDDLLVIPWDRDVATEIAAQNKLILTDLHWEVVSFMRHHYDATGPLDYARDLSVVLDSRFKSLGGLAWLYTLFPGGPVTMGCKIAGIPIPKGNRDPAFGHVS